jgi:hypothetical protein
MTPKVDNVLYFSNDRKTVTVAGPIDDWQNDEAAAVFSVVVSQASGNGGPTTAIGSSTVMYEPNANRWIAVARVTRDSMQFHQGDATARAWATIAQPGGGAEVYPWAVDTKLQGH